MTEFLYETRYGDFKDFENVRTATLLDIVQDISIKASEEAGYGIYVLHDRGLAWLMAGITFKILKRVDTKNPILAKTGVHKMGGVTSNRGCILMQNDEIVAKSIANWFLMDIVEERLTRIPKEMLEAYPTHDFGDEFFTYKKPKFPQFTGEGEAVKVCNRDIDTNCHLNNVKALEIILDGVSPDFEFNTLDIIYKRESYLGDTLIREVIESDGGYYIALLGEDKGVNVMAYLRNE